MGSKDSLTVLYVIGNGRSGSTLLDIVLGNHPLVESTGERVHLTRTGWISRRATTAADERKRRLPLCSCGGRLDVPSAGEDEVCPFWKEVRKEWVRRAGSEDIEGYPGLQEAFERHRRWPRLLRERHRPSPEFRSYARLTLALFEAIRDVSGKPVVVDSSKSPPCAFPLALVPGLDLRAVHLVRDVRGVISSRSKALKKDIRAGIEWDHEPHPVWRSAWWSSLRWSAINLESEMVCRWLGPGRWIRLRYEDFLEDPEGSLRRIGGLVGLDLAGLGRSFAAGKEMHVGHNVGGNRLRMSGSVRLRPEAGSWEDSLSPAEVRLAGRIAGPLMRRYGYAG
ncbi:sulfotransferase [Rubrobacter xylanophilus]|uniref:Sulfotransferase n=1 Tax=Rubrobacter xylanophilus TaxID=49319 RepID=A0A510HHA1_9ACTN|nr:sulfotransferase [Rubrobacter xylanophilus]BBL79329.1 sulfotransferase [Rubrobacter xylanophilus]